MYLLLTLFFYISLLGIVTTSPTHLENQNERHPSLGIINGDESAEPEAPYFVSVITYEDEVSKKVVEFCGGTILSERYVLTAAHCMPRVTYYEVIAGTHLLHGANRLLIPGYKYKVHEHYVPPPVVHNDLAILMVKQPFDFSNPRLKPVQLPTWSQANNSYVGLFGRIFGRGDVKSSQPWNVYTEELRYVVTQVIQNSDCHYDFPDVWDKNLCTSGTDGGRRIGACKGDSGGPLMYQDTEIAVVSYGEDVCEAGKPSVFTDLGKYLKWLEDNSDVVIRN